jgi:hypothetical protein
VLSLKKTENLPLAKLDPKVVKQLLVGLPPLKRVRKHAIAVAVTPPRV